MPHLDYPDVQCEDTAANLVKIFGELGFITSGIRTGELLRVCARAAKVSDITILLEGETGTGKQVVAEAIHKLDPKRKNHAFVTIHCGTIQESLAESEFFGHRKGAFSGADGERAGLFQTADRGTVFLDDVNDLPISLQPKLLDVLQRGRVRSIGCDREFPIDVRVIAASNRPLEPLVERGLFRRDLFHRLHVIKLWIPPLRERKEDLPLLLLSLAHRHQAIYGPIRCVSPELVSLFSQSRLEGNVRELENSIKRMLFLKESGDQLDVSDWPDPIVAAQIADPEDDPYDMAVTALLAIIAERRTSLAEALREVERRTLQTAVETHDMTRRALADVLHTSERTLYHKLKSHSVSRSNHKIV
jgi:DNA-binding NtrC family response regulator